MGMRVVPNIASIETINVLRASVNAVKSKYPHSEITTYNYAALKVYSASDADLCVDYKGQIHLLENSPGIKGLVMKVINFLKKCFYHLGVLCTRKWPSVFLAQQARSALRIFFFQHILPRIPDLLEARRTAFELRKDSRNQPDVVSEMVYPQITNILDPDAAFKGQDLIAILEGTARKMKTFRDRLGSILNLRTFSRHKNDILTDGRHDDDLARITYYFVNEEGHINPFWLNQRSS